MVDSGESASLPEGTTIANFRIGKQIGSGGFGEVYAGRHSVLDRDVAIKLLHRRYTRDPSAVARFVSEARAVSRISHPGIVEVIDFGSLDDGRQYFVMELVDGATLRHVLDERSRLPYAEAVDILAGIADAVDAAHGAGVAHRDLKPDNIFVTKSGVKLIDFGLAKLTHEDSPTTQTGTVLGTPQYMSPEQCRGKAADARTDHYSFGVIAYQLLTGELPFTGDALALALHHLNDEPAAPSTKNPALGPRDDAVVLSLLAKDPTDRPPSLVAAIEMLRGARPIAVRSRRWVRWVPIGGLVAVASTIGLALALRGDDTPMSPSVERASMTRARMRMDGWSPWLGFDRDPGILIYSDDGGAWRYTVATGAVEKFAVPIENVTLASPLPDGRYIVEHADDAGKVRTAVYDPRTNTHEELLDANDPSISPDGTRIAAFRDGWLVVYDIATRSERRLVQSGDSQFDQAPPRWSPDGAQLLWGQILPNARIVVTTIANGSTRTLPLPYTSLDFFGGADFLADGRVAYCSGPHVRVRDIADSSSEDVIVADLGTGSSDCTFATRGTKLAVMVTFTVDRVGVIALDAPSVMRTPAGPTYHDIVELDDREGYGFDASWHPEAVSLVDGTSRQVPTCVDTQGFVRREGVMTQLQLDGRAVRLRDPSCAIVGEWALSEGAVFAAMRCRAHTCAIVARVGDELVAWRAAPDGSLAEILRAPNGAGTRGTLALSPDGSRIAITAYNTQHVYVVSARGGPPQTFSILETGAVNGVAWGAEPDAFYQATQYADGTSFAVMRVSLADGKRSVTWSSKTQNANGLLGDEAGSRLVAPTAEYQQELVLLDVAKLGRSRRVTSPPTQSGLVAASGASMQPGTRLSVGEEIASPNGRFHVGFASGAITARTRADTYWKIAAGAKPTAITMQANGELVVFDAAGTIVWRSQTFVAGSSLVIGDDGALAIRGPTGALVMLLAVGRES